MLRKYRSWKLCHEIFLSQIVGCNKEFMIERITTTKVFISKGITKKQLFIVTNSFCIVFVIKL